MGVRNGATDGRWSSPLVVRVLGLVVLLSVALAGLAVAALSSTGGVTLPMEHGVEQPSAPGHRGGLERGVLPVVETARQGSW